MEGAMNAMRRRYVAKAIETGRILPRFVTPSDVRDLKNRIDPFVRAIDGSVAACPALPHEVADGWSAFSKAWRSFYDEEDSWWHTAAQMDQGEAYELDVQRWQQKLAGYKCASSAPAIAIEDGAGASDSWAGTFKTVAIAGAVIAVALGVRAFVR
jgi:hypothetical protein